MSRLKHTYIISRKRYQKRKLGFIFKPVLKEILMLPPHMILESLKAGKAGTALDNRSNDSYKHIKMLWEREGQND